MTLPRMLHATQHFNLHSLYFCFIFFGWHLCILVGAPAQPKSLIYLFINNFSFNVRPHLLMLEINFFPSWIMRLIEEKREAWHPMAPRDYGNTKMVD